MVLSKGCANACKQHALCIEEAKVEVPRERKGKASRLKRQRQWPDYEWRFYQPVASRPIDLGLQ